VDSLELEFKTKNPKQIEAAKAWLNSDIEEILYGGAKGGGKSFLGASLIFGDALIYPGTHYFIARQEGTDLRKFTIPTIHEVFRLGFQLDIERYTRFNGQDNYFHLHNDSRVYLLPCKEVPSDPLYERFGSMQMTRGWIEEGGEVAEAAKNNLWLSIGRWRNEEYQLKKKLLITANPKKGWMKRDFVDPWKQGVLARTRIFIPARATDNAYLSDDYRNTLKNQKDVVARQRLWEGDWDYSEDKDSLISFDALSDAFTNTIVKDGEKYMVVDVARLGKDTTVFSFWDGLEKYKVEQYSKLTTTQTAQKLKDFAAAERIPYSHILVDEDGIGGSVIDQCPGVKGFVANSSPVTTAERIRERQNRVDHSYVATPIFGSLKAQCGWKLAELINEHKIAFSVPEYRDTIIEELTSLLRDRSVDSENKKQLRKKEDVKEELGRSPDVGDTILMRMFFELLKNITPGTDAQAAQVAQEQKIVMSRNRSSRPRNSAR
jgi:phage terminase large subunit